MILVVDNYDSFTYNLVQYLGILGAEIVVRRNDEVSAEEILELNPAGIMLSPGPCTPERSGVCLTLLAGALDDSPPKTEIEQFLQSVPIFGVCLGMQATGLVSGGAVVRAKNIMHGKTSMVRHDGQGVFSGMPNPFRAVRYHSLVIQRDSLPETFVATAFSEDDNEIMGVRHKMRDIEGVQFHPESVLTESGLTIVENFLKKTRPVLAEH